MPTTTPNLDALRRRAEEAAAEAATLQTLLALDLATERTSLADAEARLAKASARLAKAREERAEAGRAVAAAESVIRTTVAPLVAAGGISVVWAAQALDLRPTLCSTKTAGSSDKDVDEPAPLQLEADQPGY